MFKELHNLKILIQPIKKLGFFPKNIVNYPGNVWEIGKGNFIFTKHNNCMPGLFSHTYIHTYIHT